MEGLLGILVGIAFLISTFSNLAKKFMEEGQSGSANKEIDRKIKEVFQEKHNIPEKNVIKEDLKNELENHEQPVLNTEGKINKKPVTADRKSSQKITIDKRAVRQTEEEDVLIKLTEKDLIKGVIFKEILDSPRARRPYLPPCLRK